MGITKGFPWTDIGVFLNFQLVNITESWTKKKIYEPFYGSSYLLIKKKKEKNFFNLILNTSYTKIWKVLIGLIYRYINQNEWQVNIFSR